MPFNDIKEIANCKIQTTLKSRKVVSWELDEWKNQNVGISETSLEDLCKSDLLSNQLVWPAKIDHNTLKDMCDVIDHDISIIAVIWLI